VLGLALASATAVHAQSAAPQSAAADAAPPPDTLPHRLTTVVVSAAAHPSLASRLWQALGSRAEFLARVHDDRTLARQLRGYDQEIARLETYLATRRARPDSLRRDITALDSATRATQAARARLEARLRILDGASAPAPRPPTPEPLVPTA
jgi:septal ring factor EnvC (AmiA/AmiB activator)